MPIDVQTPAPFKSLARYLAGTGAVSSVITMTDNTTAIEIAAGSAPVIMRWVSVADGSGANSSVTAANWDHAIPANQVRRFVVPIETGPYGVGPNASAVGVAVENGLFHRVAYSTGGVASVMVSEYGSSNSY